MRLANMPTANAALAIVPRPTNTEIAQRWSDAANIAYAAYRNRVRLMHELHQATIDQVAAVAALRAVEAQIMEGDQL